MEMEKDKQFTVQMVILGALLNSIGEMKANGQLGNDPLNNLKVLVLGGLFDAFLQKMDSDFPDTGKLNAPEQYLDIAGALSFKLAHELGIVPEDFVRNSGNPDQHQEPQQMM